MTVCYILSSMTPLAIVHIWQCARVHNLAQLYTTPVLLYVSLFLEECQECSYAWYIGHYEMGWSIVCLTNYLNNAGLVELSLDSCQLLTRKLTAMWTSTIVGLLFVFASGSAQEVSRLVQYLMFAWSLLHAGFTITHSEHFCVKWVLLLQLWI